MSSETASVQKRKFDDVADDDSNDDESSQRRDTKNRHQATRCSSFLPCHLKMLRALYVDSIKSELTDGAVSDQVWDMIQFFLDGRHELRRIKNEAQRWRIIVDESKDYVEKQRPAPSSSKNCGSTSKSPMMWQPTSPLEKRLFAPSPYQAIHAGAASIGRSSGPTSSSSLALVSKILERRACVAENNARNVVHPFHELYTAVCKRAERLDSLLESSTPDPTDGSTQASPDKDDNDEKRSNEMEVDAKNRLWKMIANDLYNVIQI
mmetsp:Transcript_20421/g.33825  ORF Transcript_20421/g.33825 Transcript_20421/m.33825 type:complete len:264 (-) Transcript_20421:307-1098(-)|eukprot:CAMPEP_0119004786 /NCGR_PEP_ID=MMETSP1176-20130426/1354_1 /TAXON_ID=265551 /ORGANISM="Synedropsis recta cf, Strain CCMP1620" /LENGTH=263 /DNA_ID=CAMNT_0006956531 /DNA_START=108 /DNA_END=899 /DNA_ORIENTATION=-